MRDDIAKLPLSKSAKRYARMTSKALGQNWSRKTDMFMDMVASTTGQEKAGFRNRDAAGKVQHSMKGIGESDPMVRVLADVANEPFLRYRRLKWQFSKGDGGIKSGLAHVFDYLGFEDSDMMAERIEPFFFHLLDFDVEAETEEGAVASLVSELTTIGVSPDYLPAFVRLAKQVVDEFKRTREAIDMADDVVESLLEGLFRADGDYYYVTNCVGSTAEKIHAMIDAGHEVSKTEFFKNVPLREVFNSGIAQIYAWTPAQCQAAGVDYEEVRQNRGGLKMWNDWAIGYYKSVYDGQECYYFDHSRIEYIFCKV